jgi:hypothetical protein
MEMCIKADFSKSGRQKPRAKKEAKSLSRLKIEKPKANG